MNTRGQLKTQGWNEFATLYPIVISNILNPDDSSLNTHHHHDIRKYIAIFVNEFGYTTSC